MNTDTLKINTKYCSFSMDELKEIFSACIEKSFKFDVQPSEDMAKLTTVSKFGGKPYSEGESWPLCTSCKEPLSFIFQCNNTGLDNFGKNVENNCLYVFFICPMECFKGVDDKPNTTYCLRKYYSPSLDKAQEMHQPEMSDFYADFYAGGANIIPSKIDLIKSISFLRLEDCDAASSLVLDLIAESPDQEEDLYQKIGEELLNMTDFNDDGDATKYLGVPNFFNDMDTPECLMCSKPMALLFQLQAEAGFSWGDAGALYIFYCPEHPENNECRGLTC
ncbi:MAG: DUF1963 domain-containing protein [Candidatus Babeliales bacterium]